MQWIRGGLLRLRWCVLVWTVLTGGCGTDTFYELFTPNPVVQLPNDEAPHDSGGEWWYYTGTLTAEDGQRFGIETVIFHVPGERVVLPVDAWAVHYAILKESDGTFLYSQANGVSRWADLTYEGGFSILTSLVAMAGFEGHDQIWAQMADGNYALDLELTDQRGPILHGLGGYISYANNSLHSFYYSRPRMQAVGTLKIDEQTLPVTGEFWFDRQWGRDIVNPFQSWDWFSLRLNDGSDVMLFVFQKTALPLFEGTYIPSAGEPIPLSDKDVTITPTDAWTSPNTGITYPVAWEIKIPPQDLVLTVKAVANDQELDTRTTTFNIYWEGKCTITGTRAGQPISGSAYVELANQ
jgi:predicted secreted hydrolase